MFCEAAVIKFCWLAATHAVEGGKKHKLIKMCSPALDQDRPWQQCLCSVHLSPLKECSRRVNCVQLPVAMYVLQHRRVIQQHTELHFNYCA